MLVKRSVGITYISRQRARLVERGTRRTMQQNSSTKLSVIIGFLIVCLGYALPAQAQDGALETINTLYQGVLTDYVSSGDKNGLPANMVDYAGVKADQRLAELLRLIQQYPKTRLHSREKQIAFYLNAYNILAIAKVTENWPLFKLRSLGSFFKPVWAHPAGEVCGDAMTLRKLEHEILRKLGDPRIHFALNCASMSCPDLRLEPYKFETLERQLTEQTHIFLSQEGKGLSQTGNELTLSPIFKWFSEDFDSAGGVLPFIKAYLPQVTSLSESSSARSTEPDWEITGYFEYDWAINDHLSAAERMKLKRSNTWFN